MNDTSMSVTDLLAEITRLRAEATAQVTMVTELRQRAEAAEAEVVRQGMGGDADAMRIEELERERDELAGANGWRKIDDDPPISPDTANTIPVIVWLVSERNPDRPGHWDRAHITRYSDGGICVSCQSSSGFTATHWHPDLAAPEEEPD